MSGGDRPDIDRLFSRLAAIEALHAGTEFEGERTAAAAAREAILARLREAQAEAPDEEFQFSIEDPWARKLFTALCRRYGIAPYRYRRQRRTTLVIKAPRRFVDGTLWPEFQAIDSELRQWLEAVTDEVIAWAVQDEPRAVHGEPPAGPAALLPAAYSTQAGHSFRPKPLKSRQTPNQTVSVGVASCRFKYIGRWEVPTAAWSISPPSDPCRVRGGFPAGRAGAPPPPTT